jgi:hypothetical protein
MDSKSLAFIGVKGDEKSRDRLRNHHFSAVASDAVGFEVS